MDVRDIFEVGTAIYETSHIQIVGLVTTQKETILLEKYFGRQ
jgi:hypothetical protein